MRRELGQPERRIKHKRLQYRRISRRLLHYKLSYSSKPNFSVHTLGDLWRTFLPGRVDSPFGDKRDGLICRQESRRRPPLSDKAAATICRDSNHTVSVRKANCLCSPSLRVNWSRRPDNRAVESSHFRPTVSSRLAVRTGCGGRRGGTKPSDGPYGPGNRTLPSDCCLCAVLPSGVHGRAPSGLPHSPGHNGLPAFSSTRLLTLICSLVTLPPPHLLPLVPPTRSHSVSPRLTSTSAQPPLSRHLITCHHLLPLSTHTHTHTYKHVEKYSGPSASHQLASGYETDRFPRCALSIVRALAGSNPVVSSCLRTVRGNDWTVLDPLVLPTLCCPAPLPVSFFSGFSSTLHISFRQRLRCLTPTPSSQAQPHLGEHGPGRSTHLFFFAQFLHTLNQPEPIADTFADPHISHTQSHKCRHNHAFIRLLAFDVDFPLVLGFLTSASIELVWPNIQRRTPHECTLVGV
ncbi:unnamed protein product [Protopolystoma xenopodis]|uniref:Uncharacterized protein n=1 Tax=Protopolystoma xenopodis TaxID=117903 RepID=A0A448XMP9_9PLAT|nr:unnamed protein product [Protopolystoma xenopodis]